MAASFGNIPITEMRCFISLLNCSSGLVESGSAARGLWKGLVGENILPVAKHEFGELGVAGRKPDQFAPFLFCVQ